MTKYHINPDSERPNICKASIRNCPVGGSSEHFDTKEEALEHREKVNAKNAGGSFSKKKPGHKIPVALESLNETYKDYPELEIRYNKTKKNLSEYEKEKEIINETFSKMRNSAFEATVNDDKEQLEEIKKSTVK